MTLLLPRLPRMEALSAIALIAERGEASPPRHAPDTFDDVIVWGASGGVRCSARDLDAIRTTVRAHALESGFPEPAGREAAAAFDAGCAEALATLPQLATPDALRDDVWSFIALALVPDVAFWRFGAAPERFAGGVRNAFQRLLVRGRLFDRGEGHPDRWGLLRMLSEDAMVAITERGGIAGQPRLARALAEGWVRCAERVGARAMEDVMRRTVIAVRLADQVRLLETLPEEELETLIDAEYRRAADAFGLAE